MLRRGQGRIGGEAPPRWRRGKGPLVAFAGASLLTAVVGGYVIWVGVRGGFVHPGQPHDHADVHRAVVEHLASRQQVETLVDLARQPSAGTDDAFMERMEDFLRREIPRAVEEHEAVRRGRLRLEEGLSADLDHFAGRHIAEMPDQMRVSVPGVRIRSVLFEPMVYYELLCSSDRRASEVFEEYVAAMVARRWLAEWVRFDEEQGQGYLVATSRGMELLICLSEEEAFDGQRTTVLWMLRYEEE